jgi:peptide chain release factor 1
MDDFEVQWFSGTGKGGQHRNKHQNCCRVIHKPTGISANGTSSRSREDNLRAAMAVCRARVAEAMHKDKDRYAAGFERVRTYHEPDNRVTDHASGRHMSYRDCVDKANLGPLIEARRYALLKEDNSDE